MTNYYSEKVSLKTITLEKVLTAGDSKRKRKIILIEGVAGAGKTTLSCHICNRWAACDLFQNIRLLIHISLSNSDIHSAQNLADIIPHYSESIKHSVADAIAKTSGKHICFILDACDEAPPSFWQSFLQRFIAGTGKLRLPNATIILCSRPGMRIECRQYLTGKIVVKGFSSDSLNKFIEDRFQGNTRDKIQLTDALEMKPELQSLCYLPLNAAILLFLYNFLKEDLPTTRTGLFHPLVCNCLIHHIYTRTTKTVSYTHLTLPTIYSV